VLNCAAQLSAQAAFVQAMTLTFLLRVVESFNIGFCDSIVGLPQRANDAFQPRKLETSCEMKDFEIGVRKISSIISSSVRCS
jgi:hypothetical protein